MFRKFWAKLYIELFCPVNGLKDGKNVRFFGVLSKGRRKAPFYFVFFPHCTSTHFRVSYSMYLNIGCNYIVVMYVLDRRYRRYYE